MAVLLASGDDDGENGGVTMGQDQLQEPVNKTNIY
jgi:hypothetical protein